MKKPLPPYLVSHYPIKQGTSKHFDTSVSLKKSRSVSTKDVDMDHPEKYTLFDLSSHQRAREAIEFAIKMRPYDYHVFVMGEERSGRMTSTLTYLNRYIESMPLPKDWIYLNNFKKPNNPKPFSLPAGTVRDFEENLQELIISTNGIFKKTLNNPNYLRQLDSLTAAFEHEIDQTVFELKEYAKTKGFDIVQSSEGYNIEYQQGVSPTEIDQEVVVDVRDRLNRMTLGLQLASRKVQKKIDELRKHTARKALAVLFQKFSDEFEPYLGEWINDLREDILANIDLFVDKDDEEELTKIPEYLRERYGVNVFVEHGDSAHSKVFVESNVTYEKLFGSINYKASSNGAFETNFTMIRPGALHLANGGILVLRGDTLAKNPDVWDELKVALRDKRIRIRERYRENNLSLVDAPEPQAIPLDIQVYLIASHVWYYTFFYNDPDFRSYFKIKADIDLDMPMDDKNINIYRHLIHQNAASLTGLRITQGAVNYLIRYSSRWAAHKERLSSKFEFIGDVLAESAVISNQKYIKQKDVQNAICLRRERNARVEDRNFEEIKDQQIFIDTVGRCIGQVNALTILDIGDHYYGLPCKLTARTHVGESGLVNIERNVELAGPLLEKGVLILEGFLNGLFAQHFPLSYNCSITFEQSYVDVDGDSASMAELIALVSSLSGIPVRQDVAITGSMNQFGKAQSIGGVHFKVEGFYRACFEKGLTGTQGVIIPNTNRKHLTLRDNVLEAIQKKKFFIWTVDSVFEAIEIMLATPCGIESKNAAMIQDHYPYYKFSKDSVFDKVFQQLKKYHQALKRPQK